MYKHENKFIDERIRLEKKRVASSNASPASSKSHITSSSRSSPAVKGVADNPLNSQPPRRNAELVQQPLALALMNETSRKGFEIMMLTPLSVVQYVFLLISRHIDCTGGRCHGGNGARRMA